MGCIDWLRLELQLFWEVSQHQRSIYFTLSDPDLVLPCLYLGHAILRVAVVSGGSESLGALWRLGGPRQPGQRIRIKY
jgi:hypothetical protein